MENHFIYERWINLKKVFLTTVTVIFLALLVFSSSNSVDKVKMDIEKIVNEAVQMVEEFGPESFPRFFDKNGPYILGDEYVFLYNDSGVCLVNVGNPSIQGKDLITRKDKRGLYVIVKLLDAALNDNGDWVEYYWEKPGEEKESKKLAYVTKAVFEEKVYMLGMGYYPEI